MDIPIEIFCWYAHQDQSSMQSVRRHLMPLQYQGLVIVWSDTDIRAGAEREQEIEKHLNTAQIILLLVSPDFMAEYGYSTQMERALQRHKEGTTRVIPVLIRPSYWEEAFFGKLQVLPKDAKPVIKWSTEDDAMFDIVKGISLVCKELLEVSNELSLSKNGQKAFVQKLTETDQFKETKKQEQILLLMQGKSSWNEWREQHPDAVLDLSSARLRYMDLKGMNLSGVNLSSARFKGANLSNANLTGSILRDARLGETILEEANLSMADLTQAYLIRAKLAKADLTKADLSAAALNDADFTEAHLTDANLNGADLSGANLSRTDLTGADLSGANLTGADLSGANFSEANLSGANLSHVYLSSANFSEANLSGANLTGTEDGVKTFPILLPRGVFISYFYADKEFVEKICIDLRRADIEFGTDGNLTPGTAREKLSAYKSIALSYALIIIISPHSQKMQHIQEWLNLANSRGCPVIPIWIASDERAESIHLNGVYMDYIDCRTALYASGFTQLVNLLHEISNSRLPEHCLLTKEYRRKYKSVYGSLPDHHSGYFHIALGNGDQVAMRKNVYHSLQSLLDNLYMGYLKDRYKPFTYGTKWILGKSYVNDLIDPILPLSWLHIPEGQVLSSFYPLWSTVPLEAERADDSFIRDSSSGVFSVLDMQNLSIFGIATNYPAVAKALGDRKLSYFVRDTLLDVLGAKHRFLDKNNYSGIKLVRSKPAHIRKYKYFTLCASYELEYIKCHKATFVVDSLDGLEPLLAYPLWDF